MTDHFDHDDYAQPDFHHDDAHHYDPHQYEPPEHLDQPEHFDDFGHDPHDLPDSHDPHPETPPDTAHHIPTTDDIHVVDDPGHHDTALDDDPGPTDVFPPAVDVGELPEPVDGFPWTDAATLGHPDPATADPTAPVDPHELAAYAGTEIPPGADPWTVLADSDDPATSTLARFWHDTGQ